MLDTTPITGDLPVEVTRSAVELAAGLRELAVLEAFRRGEIGTGKGEPPAVAPQGAALTGAPSHRLRLGRVYRCHLRASQVAAADAVWRSL